MSDRRDDWYGLHETLLSKQLIRTLEELDLADAAVLSRKIDSEQLPAAVLAHLARVLSGLLLSLRQDRSEEWVDSVGRLKRSLEDAGHPLAGLLEDMPLLPFEQLLAVRRPEESAVGARDVERPDIPLGLSALLTGSRHSPSLIGQIEKELASADRADWLVSFIKFSGIRALKAALRRFVEREGECEGPRLRVATTSYLGATDLKAIKALLELPNTEVRVSFDTHRTRLHAKAYLFHRRTGFGTAYVGSANVSRVALDEGLEWTARISQHELGYLWRQVVAGFQMHWSDPAEFEPITLEDLPRLEEALAAEKHDSGAGRSRSWHFLELRPHGFQQEILESIAEERSAGIGKHLIIAATGTGKTMIAAFDYRRYCQSVERDARPSLLFVAHREEILGQAMNAFRHVLRDESFGGLLVGGRDPGQARHLFCSVQSWNARDLARLPRDHFDYVVLDEAHHAQADSYQSILDHIEPQALIGLTATPERADGRDIRADFGGRFTHEMRLADAIEARHLVPFHYFGIADEPDVDFSHLDWPRGGYRTQDLERIVGSNERRARWVLQALEESVAAPDEIRALGFCVSKAHARFMADYFSVHGVAAEALTADSADARRRTVKRRLVNGEVQVIFTVDLFNEGVDIPEVDTVLLLRPTESLTVYLQQLGRGLRLHESKAHLTVLDFIAPQNRRFRFADRFRALMAGKEQRVDEQIKAGFPWLPAGCLIRLDERAQEVVLGNIRDALAQKRTQVIQHLQTLRQQLDEAPSLDQMLDWLHFDDADLLLKHGLPSRLLKAAGAEQALELGEFEKGLSLGVRQLLLVDDREALAVLRRALDKRLPADDEGRQQLLLGLTLLWGAQRPSGGAETALQFLQGQAPLVRDLQQIIEWRLRQLLPAKPRRFPMASGMLALHCAYSSEQILLALGLGDFNNPPSLAGVGVKHVKSRKVDAFFVTISKSDRDFSPTTQYEDYALNAELFHWQSQSATSPESPTGQRYIHHAEQGYQPLLFVRSGKRLPNGLTEPFRFVGPADYVSHEGSKPMSIIWRLRYPLLARDLREYRNEVI